MVRALLGVPRVIGALTCPPYNHAFCAHVLPRDLPQNPRDLCASEPPPTAAALDDGRNPHPNALGCTRKHPKRADIKSGGPRSRLCNYP